MYEKQLKNLKNLLSLIDIRIARGSAVMWDDAERLEKANAISAEAEQAFLRSITSNRESLRQILVEYQKYETELLKKEIADGAPRPADGPRFSFARFFNWIFDLEQK